MLLRFRRFTIEFSIKRKACISSIIGIGTALFRFNTKHIKFQRKKGRSGSMPKKDFKLVTTGPVTDVDADTYKVHT